MKKYAYYPGCALTTLASEYDASFRNLCARMGIELARFFLSIPGDPPLIGHDGVAHHTLHENRP